MLRVARLLKPRLDAVPIIRRSAVTSSTPEDVMQQLNSHQSGFTDRQITDMINLKKRLPRSLIKEHAYQISLFEAPKPLPMKETIDLLFENAHLDFIDKSQLKFKIRMNCPDMKRRKDKSFGWTHFFLEIPHVFQKPNKVFIFVEGEDSVKALKEAGFSTHALDSQGTRTMMANPIDHDIFAAEKTLIKKMNRDVRIREKLDYLFPIKAKNTTSENYPVIYDWIAELERLRDKCLVCTTNTDSFHEEFGDGELSSVQLETNLLAMIKECQYKFKTISNAQISNGSDEWFSFEMPNIQKKTWQDSSQMGEKKKKKK